MLVVRLIVNHLWSLTLVLHEIIILLTRVSCLLTLCPSSGECGSYDGVISQPRQPSWGGQLQEETFKKGEEGTEKEGKRGQTQGMLPPVPHTSCSLCGSIAKWKRNIFNFRVSTWHRSWLFGFPLQMLIVVWMLCKTNWVGCYCKDLQQMCCWCAVCVHARACPHSGTLIIHSCMVYIMSDTLPQPT